MLVQRIGWYGIGICLAYWTKDKDIVETMSKMMLGQCHLSMLDQQYCQRMTAYYMGKYMYTDFFVQEGQVQRKDPHIHWTLIFKDG